MQIGFSAFVDIIGFRAVLAAAFLPALTLMTYLPGRYDVFPFDTTGAFGVFARNVATTGQIDPFAGVLAAAIEFGGLRRIQAPADFLGFTEGARSVGVCGK